MEIDAIRLVYLAKRSMELFLEVVPTRVRIDKSTKERYFEYSRKDYIDAIRAYYLKELENIGRDLTGLNYILRMKSPMLAKLIKSVPEDLVDNIWGEDSDYIAEEKINGIRLIVIRKNNKLEAYSRVVDEQTLLPISYGDRLFESLDSIGPDYVIDGELILKNSNYRSNMETIMNIVSLDSKSSVELFKVNPLKYIVFDILEYGKESLVDKPLIERQQYLKEFLKRERLPIEIEEVRRPYNIGKRDFYNQIVSTGGEGVILKDLSSTYDIAGKRDNSWLKAKRPETESYLEDTIGDTLDMYVMNYIGSGRDYISALTFGLIVLYGDREVVTSIITVGNLPETLRKRVSGKDINGNIILLPEIYGLVASIDIKRENNELVGVIRSWRPDKSAGYCKIQRDLLDRVLGV